jgi:hypothetical protein
MIIPFRLTGTAAMANPSAGVLIGVVAVFFVLPRHGGTAPRRE